MSLPLSKKPRLSHENFLSADDILPREIWLEIAKVHPSAWISLSLVVPAVGAAARDPVKQRALMTRFTGPNGRLPNGQKHGKHKDVDATSYYCNGKFHRDEDKPAWIYWDGTLCWYQHGKLHRNNDQPAWIDSNGTQRWVQHGLFHRDNDLPAIVTSNGAQYWFQHGKPHRDNDKPAWIASDHVDGSNAEKKPLLLRPIADE